MTSKWTYVCRTIPEIDVLLRPLDEVIHQHFIPAITGCPPCSPLERQLLALPPRLGGLGLSNPSFDSQSEFESSKQVTASLVAMIVVLDLNGSVTDEPKHSKASIRKAKREKQLADALEVKQQLMQQQRGSWNVQPRRAPRHGLQPYPSMITASSCTRGISGLPSASAMAGQYLVYPTSAAVAQCFPLTTS